MTEDQERFYEPSLDYRTEYADGAILEIGDAVSRIIFYQEEMQLTEGGKAFDKQKKLKRLKLEVRIPHSALFKLSTNSKYLFELQQNAHHLSEGSKDDTITNAWYDYDNKISSIIYDTDEFMPKSKEVQELQDKFDELKGRLSRKNTDEQKK